MSSKALTRELYGKLEAAFRAEPGNITAAARTAGCTWETAKKAWTTGWTRRAWAPSIRATLEREIEEAKAARWRREQEAAQAEMDRQVQARLDSIQARAEEAQGSKVSRKNALNLAVVSGKMIVLADAMVNELKRRVDSGLSAFKDDDLRRWMNSAAMLVHRAESVMRLALEIERVVVGEPVAVLGVKVEDMSPEHMVKELQGIARTLGRAQNLSNALKPGAADPDSSPGTN